MSEIPLGELSFIATYSYCVLSACVLLIYDWLLCLEQEVRFIWTWRSRGVTLASLVYAVSRYAWLLQNILTVATLNPISDLSCRANAWSQAVSGTMGLIAVNVFSGLRAYALSNRSLWLVAIIIALGLPSVVMRIVEHAYQAPVNQPPPFNCGVSSSLSPLLSDSASIVLRVTQLASELLVVGITWWYTYQSYRIRKGLDLGKTISSLLFYNGSLYFLFLATLFILDAIVGNAPLPAEVQNAAPFLEAFIDPVSSVLTCHFMLSLRQFDSTIANATNSGLGPQLQEHMAGSMLQFGAQPGDSLPASIASFANPLHAGDSLFESEPDPSVEDETELPETDMDPVVPTLETPSAQGPSGTQSLTLEDTV